jgi:S-layer family protein
MRRRFTVLLAVLVLFSLLTVPVGKVSALTNLVQDPSLEAAYGSTLIWKQSSTNSDTPVCKSTVVDCTVATGGPRTGMVWAQFGGLDWSDPDVLSPEVADIYQNVTFPNSCSASLQFYLWIGDAAGDANDVFNVIIDNNSATPVFSANATQQSTYPSYTLVSVDVSAFANGNSHKVEFFSRQFKHSPSQTVTFNLDDVSLTDTCFTISGNAGVADATLNYTGGSTTADGSGNYSFKVPTGWSGTVTPSKGGYVFSPANKTYSNVVADQTEQNYTAIPALVVTNTNDSGSGSLRQTIINSSAGNGITFDPSLAGQTITLSSQLVIDKNLIIDGSALASKINISGNNSVRAFVVNSGVTVVMNNLSIKNGKATGNGGAISNNGGTLTVTNSTISDSNATADGGAIYNGFPGVLTINESVFNNNGAARGGGIMCSGLGTLTIMNSTYSSNHAPSGFGDGGAIYTTCNATIANSTLSANTAANSGGAITTDNDTNPVVITNSTFYSNSAPAGGGIANFGGLNLKNSTLSNNNSSNGGALRNGLGGVLSLRNSILANSTGGVDCIKVNTTTAVENINNLIETTGAGAESCGTSLLSVDPMLNSLADNGGSTQTMALRASSPAINAGDDASCAAAPVNNLDQRGVTRPQGNHCDMGAYEKTRSFEDVQFDYWAWSYIERLYDAGITSGCSVSPVRYCPEGTVTRAQMAVFLERGIHGSSYTPPAVGGSTGFSDVPIDYWAAAWIKQLAAEGITGGCGTGIYCPEGVVTRAQMAVLLLRSKHGSSYTPPAVGSSTGFGDVATNYWAAAWIKQLVTEGITAGCGSGNYCPESAVTRAQMAVFLVRTFNLP